jgi:hypothetical protein
MLVIAERPDERSLFGSEIVRNRLVDVDAMDKDRTVLVNPNWQRTGQQA